MKYVVTFLSAGSSFMSQGRTMHKRLCLTISQRWFLLVTLVDTPMPHVREQADHSVVCSMQFTLGSQASKPTVSSCL